MKSERFKLAQLMSAGLHLTPNEDLLNLLTLNSASGLPYHNNEHAYAVAVQACFIGQACGVSHSDLRHLFVAGLLHDYNHSGDKNKTDSDNIDAALVGVDVALEVLETDQLDANLIRSLIMATNKDNLPDKEYSLLESIIHDADVLEWGLCSEDRFLELCEGLSLETGIPVTLDSTKQFLSSRLFHTQTAQECLEWNGLLTDEGSGLGDYPHQSWYEWALESMSTAELV